MNQIAVGTIITYLNTIDDLTDIVWDRIFFWFPISDVQDWIYIAINIITERRDRCSKWTYLEFKIIANDNNVTFDSLLAVRNIISDYFIGNKDMSWFYVYWVNEDGTFKNGYDEKNRKVIIQDYLFNYVT
jgi:hypothetical protein